MKSTFSHPLQRERLRKGWTQQQLADFAQVSITTIERAERGKAVRVDICKRICEALGKERPEELGILCFGMVENGSSITLQTEYTQEKSVDTRFNAQENGLLSTTSLKAVPSLSPPPPEMSISSSPDDRLIKNSEHDTESRDVVGRREALQEIAVIFGGAFLMFQGGAINSQWLDRLIRAHGKLSNIDEETLKYFEAITVSCWHLMMRGELETAEQTLWGYLPKLAILAKQPSEYQRTGAGIASKGYLLAASLAGHRGDLNSREHYCQQALLYGNLAQDRNLQVSALKQLALTFEYKDRPGTVLHTYQKAIPYLNEVTPLLRARMYAGLAGAHAQCEQKQGGQMQEALNSLALAYDSFPEHPQNDPSFLYADCDYFTIILWDGLVHLDLDQPDEARKAFERIDGLKPKRELPEKVRIEFLNYQAEAYTRLGTLDQAYSYLEEAVNASLAIGSERRYLESLDVYKQMQMVWRHEQRVKTLGRLFIR